jgi:phosphonate transport system substrate-binding protein
MQEGNMHHKNRVLMILFALITVMGLLLTACQSAATPTAEPTAVPPTAEPPTAVPPTVAPPTETPAPAVGSQEHPIKVLFVPSVDANVIVSGGKIMADALNKATGLYFDVSVPTSYAATIEAVCASPNDTMVFIPGLGYVLANQLCGVDVSFKAVRYGFDVYWAEVLVKRDSPYKTLKDLDGKKWGYTDAASTSGYMVPLIMFEDAGIKPSESVATGGHPQAVKAVYNGEVDFATAFYSAPLKPAGEPAWKVGDPFDIPDNLVSKCAVTQDGKSIKCGDWTVLDARANIRTEAPDVVQKVRILTISDPVPNDTLSFGPTFDKDLRKKIEDALVAFSKTDDWKKSLGSSDFYGWTGINPAKDAEYDIIRKMVKASGLTLEKLGQ